MKSDNIYAIPHADIHRRLAAQYIVKTARNVNINTFCLARRSPRLSAATINICTYLPNYWTFHAFNDVKRVSFYVFNGHGKRSLYLQPTQRQTMTLITVNLIYRFLGWQNW